MLLAVIESGWSASLLRTPKVYNALITTDQNLTPSRAFPVVRPAIRESPWLYPPYSFTPWRFYDSYGPFNGLGNTEGLYARYKGNGVDISSETANTDRTYFVNHEVNDNSISHHLSSKSPIAVNEWGLPPSLVPLTNHRPVDLAPYSFHSYPLIADHNNGWNQGEYLPHFGYVPQNSYAATVSGTGIQPGGSITTTNTGGTTSVSDTSVVGLPAAGLPIAGASTTTTSNSGASGTSGSDSSSSSSGGGSSEISSAKTSTSSGGQISSASTSTRSGRVFYFDDDIKNNHNRNKDIVDVPPPPLPLGAKTSDQE